MSDRLHLSLVASARQASSASLPQLMNLSEGSLIVRSRVLLEPGQAVQVAIHFIDSGVEVQIEAEVVWANQPLGDMALRFVTISHGGREAIAEYLAERIQHR